MILALIAALAAQPRPAYDTEMARVTAAVPEAVQTGDAALPDRTADWVANLPTADQRDVALLVLLSYSQAVDGKRLSTAANIAMGLAYAAASVAQNQNPKQTDRTYTADTPVPMRGQSESARLERTGRAQRALAWGHRLGLCDAAFVTALRALPAPAAAGDPDLRPVVHDLGMLAYNPDCAAEPH